MPKTYTFKLRPNQKFERQRDNDGETTLAFSLQRVVILDKTPAFLFTQLRLDQGQRRDPDPPRPTSSTPEVHYSRELCASRSCFEDLMATVAASVVEKRWRWKNEVSGDLSNT